MSSFVDSNIFIYAATDSKHKENCRKYLEFKSVKIINTLVLLETYAGILKITKNKDYAVRFVKSIMGRDDIQIVNFDNNLFFETLKRVSKFDIKFNDVAHYVTGLLNGCSGIISYDADFDNKNIELKRYEPSSVLT